MSIWALLVVLSGQADPAPDRLLLTEGAQLWTCDADGADRVRLTTDKITLTPGDRGPSMPPLWSPDRSAILFEGYEPRRWYVVGLADRKIVPVSPPDLRLERWAWSPDSKSLACIEIASPGQYPCAVSPTGEGFRRLPGEGTSAVWQDARTLLVVDHHSLRSIATGDPPSVRILRDERSLNVAAVSADGKRCLRIGRRDIGQLGWDAFLADVDGNRDEFLVDDVGSQVVWSPDGARVVIDGRVGQTWDCAVVELATRRRTWLRFDRPARYGDWLGWSPDGRTLVRAVGQGFEVVDVTGEPKTLASFDPGPGLRYYTSIGFSRDGSRVYWSHRQTVCSQRFIQPEEFWCAERDGTKRRKLHARDDAFVQWIACAGAPPPLPGLPR